MCKPNQSLNGKIPYSNLLQYQTKVFSDKTSN